LAASVGRFGLAAGTSARRVDLAAGLTPARGRFTVLDGGLGSARAIARGGSACFRGAFGDGAGCAVLRFGGVLPLDDFTGVDRLGALANGPPTAGRAFVAFGCLAGTFWGFTALGFGGGVDASLTLSVLCGAGSVRFCVCFRSGALGAGVYDALVPPRCPPLPVGRFAHFSRRSDLGAAVERGV